MDCMDIQKKPTTTTNAYVVALSCITNIFNGLVYMYPNLSNVLENTLGLSVPQIVVIGTSSYLGIGAMQYPLGLFYRSKWLSNRTKIHGLSYGDRIVTLISLVLLFVATLGITLFAKYLPFGSNDEDQINFIFFVAFFILFGAGTGASYGHTVWLNNHNYLQSPWRRTVLTLMSFSFAFGAMISSIIYPYTWDHLSLSNIFLFHFVCYMVLGIPGLFFLIRFEVKPEQTTEDSKTLSLENKNTGNDKQHLLPNKYVLYL